jgi:cell division protein FtsQ
MKLPNSPAAAPARGWVYATGAGRALLAVAIVIACVVSAAELYRHRPAIEAVRDHPYFAIERIAVRGAGNLVSEEEVLRWSGVREGDSLWDAAPQALKERVESHPMVRTASVRRLFPNTLEIGVRERRPAAIAVLDDLYYVDRNGDRFGPLEVLHDRDYPVFTGLTEESDGQRRWALRRALHLLRRAEVRGLDLEISEIHLDPVEGLILYPASPRVPLFLGWRGWERRLQRAHRALASWDGVADRLARMDMRYRDQVVIEVREPRLLQVGREQAAKVST